MKKLLSILFVVAMGFMCISLNSVYSDDYHEYATVDTDPAAAGYWTNEVSIRAAKGNNQAENVFFSIRGTGSMSITLQYKCFQDAGWTDYDVYTAVDRLVIEGGAVGEVWRAGVKDADYTSGSLTFGFDW